MSDAFEAAALAFDTDSGIAPKSSSKSESSARPVESMFGSLGDLDADSDIAGGDELEAPGEVKEAKKVVKKAPAEDDEGDDELDELEDEGDEGDDEDGDEDDADEDESKAKKADEEDDSDVYEVTVDGERAEVTLKEALNGYVRQETFHRRLNWLNDVKQEVHKEAIAVMEDRKTYADKLSALQKQLDLLVPQEPNWAEEYKKDPVAAEVLQKQFASYKTQREAIDAEEKRVRDEQAKSDEKAMADYANAENAKILRNNPSWKDEKVMQRDVQSMAETARKAGFTEEEIANTKDSRMVQILLKAAKYDRLTANKPKPIRKGKTPVQPGAGSKRTAPKGLAQAQRALQRSGSVDDAANVFTQIIR